jgi:hypothetical protein
MSTGNLLAQPTGSNQQSSFQLSIDTESLEMLPPQEFGVTESTDEEAIFVEGGDVPLNLPNIDQLGGNDPNLPTCNQPPVGNNDNLSPQDKFAKAVNLAIWLKKSTEGFISEAMWDVNNWRIGHGSGRIHLASLPDWIINLNNKIIHRPVKLDIRPGPPKKPYLSFQDAYSKPKPWLEQIYLDDRGKAINDGAVDPVSKLPLSGSQLKYMYHASTSRKSNSPSGGKWKENVYEANLITIADATFELKSRITYETYKDTKQAVLKATQKAGLNWTEADWDNLNYGWWVVCMNMSYGYGTNGAWARDWTYRHIAKYWKNKSPDEFGQGLLASDAWYGHEVKPWGHSVDIPDIGLKIKAGDDAPAKAVAWATSKYIFLHDNLPESTWNKLAGTGHVQALIGNKDPRTWIF